MYDRIWAIESVDRGETPFKGISGEALRSLQERNLTLMLDKVREVDYFVRERGRWFISGQQNFGHQEEPLSVDDTATTYQGTAYLNRIFDCVVAAGSTYALTDSQKEDRYLKMFQLGLLPHKNALELLNVPDYKEIQESLGEGLLGQAIQIMIQAGWPEDEPLKLPDGQVLLPPARVAYQYLMMNQGGPGDRPQLPVQPQTPPNQMAGGA